MFNKRKKVNPQKYFGGLKNDRKNYLPEERKGDRKRII